MAVRHVITIQVAPGRAADFGTAFRAVQQTVLAERGCEQYELFQSLDDPDRMLLLERWTTQALLEQHMAAERTRNAEPLERLITLWSPGTTPTLERYET
ncbi:MAG TPA: antibiotic biosynthesis monooxygenase family protein [Kribbella sp.]